LSGGRSSRLYRSLVYDAQLATHASAYYIEYMQAGKPVICSDTGGNTELIEHGVSGYLYPVGDTAALAGYMSELLAERDIRQRRRTY
ncbi:MAG: glycosyltransferase, partial [Bacteroidetes bacterium]|nr:glycosyltransferase [Bacteroidota bacterium]